MAGHPDHGGSPKRSALEQLPLKQRVLAEQRGFIVPRQAGADGPDDEGDAAPGSSEERRGSTVGVIVVLLIALALVVGVIALGAALR